MRIFVILFTLAGLLCAQRHKMTINAETPEGQELQKIGQETAEGPKMALMEAFVEKYPKHEGAGWVLEQMIAANLKTNQFDKAMAAGDKLIAIDPDDVASAHNCLKAAEGKKDPDAIRKWAGITSKAARKAAAAPKPSNDDDVEGWKASVDYAKQVDTYTEYSLYATALASVDNAKKIMLYEALQAQAPQSQYLPQLNGVYFLSLRQTNNTDKAMEFAEKTLEKDQTNEDMLLAVADNYMNKKKDPDKAILYSTKLAELMATKPKPEGMSDADWEKRKTFLMGLGYWMAGVSYSSQNKHVETDANLRKALPLVDSNQDLKAQALFLIALANYRLGEPKKDKKYLAEALKYNQQCAAIKSQFQAPAQKNVIAIKQQLGVK